MSTIHFTAWQDRIIEGSAPDAIAKEMGRRRASRAYILIPEALRLDTGFADALAGPLEGRIAAIYSSLPQHSPLPSVVAAAMEAREAGADILVSIGGGSNIDAAKVVQFCLSHDAFDMPSVLEARDSGSKHAPICAPPAHVCVPTTLSGAEFTYFAGARNPDTGLKEAFVSPDLLPATLIFDQALSTKTPRDLWLSSGLRAMDHAIEALYSGRIHSFGEVLALKGLEQLREGLAKTHADPGDLAARRMSQYGGWFASVPLMSGVPMGASHAIGHAIGSLFDIPHGLTSCIGLPAVMRFNYDAAPDRFLSIAQALGGKEAHEAPELLRSFIAGLGLPTSLSEVGLGREAFPAIVAGAMEEGWVRTNPRPIADGDDIVRILELMI